MSRSPLRYSTIGHWHAQNLIPEGEVFDRVLTSIKTMRKLPSAAMQSVRSNWPRELEFHGEAIKVAVFAGNLEDKKFKKLAVRDFEDVYLGPPADDEPVRDRPATAHEITDASVAGLWFAKVALLPHNFAEFQAVLERHRKRKANTTFVADQKILSWLSRGFSIRSIGEHRDIRLDDRQVERRISQISRDLFRIANKTARLVDPEGQPRRYSDAFPVRTGTGPSDVLRHRGPGRAAEG